MHASRVLSCKQHSSCKRCLAPGLTLCCVVLRRSRAVLSACSTSPGTPLSLSLSSPSRASDAPALPSPVPRGLPPLSAAAATVLHWNTKRSSVVAPVSPGEPWGADPLGLPLLLLVLWGSVVPVSTRGVWVEAGRMATSTRWTAPWAPHGQRGTDTGDRMRRDA